MRSKMLDSQAGRRTIAVVFEAGEEVSAGLLRLAREEQLEGCQLSGLGALQDVVLGFWDRDQQDYLRIQVAEQVEVLSLVGNLARGGGPAGDPVLHAHLVIGKRDGTAHGGHLLEAHVRPTLEVVLVESPRHLQRRLDPATQLALLLP